MSNLNRYDYESTGANVDQSVLEAERKKRETIRKRIGFFIKTVICHVLAVALYLVVFANTGDFKSYYDIQEERKVLIIFSIIAVAVFGALISIELYKSAEAKEAYLKDKPFDKKKHFALARDGVLTYAILYFLIQLPSAVYHLFAGYDYVETSIFEYFYVLDMGLMELTHIGIIGAILNVIIFTATLLASRYFIIRAWQKDEDRFDKGEKMKRKYG